MSRSLDAALRRTCVNLYRYLSTPRALSCYIMMKYGEWDQLVTLSVDPRNYHDTLSGANKLRRDLMATDFLRKFESVPATFNRLKAAKATFDDCEKACFQTNEFMNYLAYPSVRDCERKVGLNQFLDRVRKICARIMGPLPDSINIGFGPGTAFEMKGRTFTTLVDKMYNQPHVTESCAQIFEHFYWPSIWGRERLRTGLSLPALCRGNRFATVPKDAKTDRGICIEPLGNLCVQLGIGRYLKGRLASVGLHVDRSAKSDDPLKNLRELGRSRPNGQFIHRRAAVMASMTGEFATIDLSNASDTVAFELVRRVIPSDWFELLHSARSPMTLKDGHWVHLEKFSSMGNGFTFELETLIFAAISAAVGGLKIGSDVLAYGDDLIVPTKYADSIVNALRTFGFTPNMRKTFTTGSFRESCGGDYFSGWSVRAVFQKSDLKEPLDWIVLHNSLKRWLPNGTTRAKGLLRHLQEQVPSSMRLSGPERLGDAVFHTSRWPWKLSYRCPKDRKIDGIRYVQGLRAKPLVLKLDRWSGELDLAVSLLGISSDGVSPRDQILGVRRCYFACS